MGRRSRPRLGERRRRTARQAAADSAWVATFRRRSLVGTAFAGLLVVAAGLLLIGGPSEVVWPVAVPSRREAEILDVTVAVPVSILAVAVLALSPPLAVALEQRLKARPAARSARW